MARPLPGSSVSSALNAVAERRNWAGNYAFRALAFESPETAGALEHMVGVARQVKVLGSGHSFNSMADADLDTESVQLSLARLPACITFDAEVGTVTAPAGFTYARLTPFLDEQGVALANLASLPHITLAGATQTGTHGSGIGNGSLSTAVVALTLCTAEGREVPVSRSTHGEAFDGMVLALGALGAVTSVTLKTEPTYMVEQRVYEHLPTDSLCESFRKIFACGYSVSAFTCWDSDAIAQVWVKRRVDGKDSAAADALLRSLGMSPAREARHPIPGLAAKHCTGQLGEPGAWHTRLPHFRSDFTPSSGDELQSEYFVAFSDGPAAIAAVARLREKIAPLLLVSELRTIAADGLWLSPCYQRASLALHFTWRAHQPEVMELLEEIEAALAPFAARPHWAKLFVAETVKIHALYPRMEDFLALRRALDPTGKFDNVYLQRVLGRL